MIDPREIEILIDADAQKALRAVNALGTGFDKALKNAVDLEKKSEMIADLVDRIAKATQAIYKVDSAAGVRQVRGGLGAISAGDLETQATNAAASGIRNKLRADAARTTVSLEKEITRTQKDQAQIMDRFLSKYDQLISLRKQINALEADARKGNATAIDQQKRLHEQAMANVRAITQQLPEGYAKATMQQRLTGAIDGPTIYGKTKFGEDAARAAYAKDFYNTKTGGSIDAKEAAAISAVADANRATKATAEERKRTETRDMQLERERQERAKTISNAEKKTYARLLREYKKTTVPALKSAADGAEMIRIQEDARKVLERQFDRIMRSRFQSEAPMFNPRQFDDEYQYATQAEQRRRRERDEQDVRAAAERENKERDRQAVREERLRTAPRDQAIAGVRRTEAYGGAGMFAIQGNLLTNYAAMGGILASVGFLGNYIVQLEKSLAQLQAISAATDGEMKGLEKTIINLARSSTFSAEEISQGATMMAQAGLSIQQISKALPAVINLAVGTGTDLATTVDTITSTLTVFNLQTAEAEDVANTLTAAMNLSKLSIDKYSLGLQYSGNIAETVGIRYNELAAIMGGLADSGVRSGSTLGTGFRQLLLDLQSPTDKAKDVFKRLDLLPSDLDIESQGIFEVLRKLKEAGFTTADATQAFEVRSVAAFKAIMNYLPEIENLNREILLTAAAEEAAAVQMDTLAAKANQLSQGLGGALYKTTESLRTSLKGVMDGLILVTGAMQFLAPVLSPLISLGITFFTVWGIRKLVELAKGFIALRTEMALAAATTGDLTTRQQMSNAAMTRGTVVGKAYAAAAAGIGATLRTTIGSMLVWSVAITAISFAFAKLSEIMEVNQRRHEAAVQASNEAKAAYDSTMETVDALSTSIEDLTNRQDALGENNGDLQSEIALLQQRFAEYGLQLSQTKDDIQSVIDKTMELRNEMVFLAEQQAGTRLAALATEKETTRVADWEKVGFGLIDSLNPFSGKKNFAPRAFGNLPGVDKASENSAKDIFSKYNQKRLFGDSSTLSGMSLEEVRSDIALLAQIRNEAQTALETLRGDPKKNSSAIKSAQKAIANFDELMELMTGFEKAVLNQSSLDSQMDTARSDQTRAQAERLAMNLQLPQKSGEAKALFDKMIKTSQDMGESGYDDDYLVRMLDQYKEDGADIIKALRFQRMAFIQQAIEQGIAADEKEADNLFKGLSVYDTWKFGVDSLDKERGLAYTTAAPALAAQAKQAQTTSLQLMRKALQEGILGIKMSRAVPDADTQEELDLLFEEIKSLKPEEVKEKYGLELLSGQQPISVAEAVKRIRSNAAAEESQVNIEFENEYPGMFETDAAGNSKFPARMGQLNEAIIQVRARRDEMIAKLYQQLNYGDDGAGGGTINEEIKRLEAEKADLEKTLSEIKGSIDSDSSPEQIQAAIDQFAAVGERYKVVRDALYQAQWKDWEQTGFDNPENAPLAMSQAFKSKESEVESIVNKGLEDLNDTLGDAAGEIMMNAAKAVFETTKLRLEAVLKNGKLGSGSLMGARMQEVELFLAAMEQEYYKQFDNNPENRKRLKDPQVQLERRQGAMEFVTQRTGAAIDLSNRNFDAVVYDGQKASRAAGVERSLLDSARNAPGVSNTQRYMADRDIEAANFSSLETNAKGAADRVAALADEHNRLLLLSGALADDSVEQQTNLQNQTNVLAELEKATRDLEQANLDLAVARDKASDPAFWDMASASIENFVLQGDILKNAGETIADSMGAIFSNMQSSLTNALYSIVTATQSTGDAFREMGASILKSLLDLALKIFTNYLIIQAIKLIGSLLPGGGFSQGFVDAFAAAGFGNVPVSKKAQGGAVVGGIANRDSVLTSLMPGEVVMRKSAVDMIGRDTLLQANATGRLAQNTVAVMRENKREPDMVNVYVIPEGKKPSIGKNDIVIALMQDVAENGATKKLIKSIAMGNR